MLEELNNKIVNEGTRVRRLFGIVQGVVLWTKVRPLVVENSVLNIASYWVEWDDQPDEPEWVEETDIILL